MNTDEKKIREYYSLKQVKALVDKKYETLNKQIKSIYSPGEHKVGQYIVNISRREKYNIYTSPYTAKLLMEAGVYLDCIEPIINQDLVESAYLREEITDEQMEEIRGIPQIITSLTVDKIEEEIV